MLMVYLGISITSSLSPTTAWQDRRELAPGRPLEIGLDAIIVDSVLADQGAVGRLMERLGR